MSDATRRRLGDYVALVLLELAKLGRRPLRSASGADVKRFYEGFFEEKDQEAYRQDPRMVRAVNFLKSADIVGTYALGVRCQVWSLLPSTPETRRLLQEERQS